MAKRRTEEERIAYDKRLNNAEENTLKAKQALRGPAAAFADAVTRAAKGRFEDDFDFAAKGAEVATLAKNYKDALAAEQAVRDE